MTGTISIVDLHVSCIIGIYPHERVEPQSLYLDLEFDTDFTSAAHTEDITHTVNYVQVSQVLTEFLQTQRFQLLETLAERSCQLVFQLWPAITRCRLTVKKPGALAEARHTAVTIERFHEAT